MTSSSEDLDEETYHRRGAHRARSGVLAAALPFVAAFVVIAAVATLTWLLVSSQLDNDPVVATPPPVDAATSAAPTPSAASPTPERELPVDRALPVVVLNGSGISGLAGRTRDELTELGWNVIATGDAQGESPATGEVLYTAPDQEGTAVALAKVLGGLQVRAATDVDPDVVTVVLVSE